MPGEPQDVSGRHGDLAFQLFGVTTERTACNNNGLLTSRDATVVRKSVKMRKLAGVTAFLGCWSLLANAFAEPSDPMRQWAQWRGPLGTGAAPHGNPPVSWSESKNIRWRAQLFGLGHSTPVVWQDKVFLTTAEPYGEKLPPQPETAPGAHGSSDYRVTAFMQGYFNGTNVCFENPSAGA